MAVVVKKKESVGAFSSFSDSPAQTKPSSPPSSPSAPSPAKETPQSAPQSRPQSDPSRIFASPLAKNLAK